MKSIKALITLSTLFQISIEANSSNGPLPQSLSSVINDLEADGANRITTAAFISSRGVTCASRLNLLKKLFGITNEEDQDDEVIDDLTTAFGKKMMEHHESDEDEEADEEDEVSESVGIAVANPLSDASVVEVAATVHACGGNIVYVASLDDLSRGEGLFEKLAPAIERILNDKDEDLPVTDDDEEEVVDSSKTLVVVVEGATTQQQLVNAKAQLESVASDFLSSIVQSDPNSRVTTLQEVFDNIEFVSPLEPVDEILAEVASSCDPTTATANVGKAVFMDSNTNVPLLSSPLDLAAARKLLPLSHQTLESCMSMIETATTDDDGEIKLSLDFGTLSDATVENCLDQFDTAAGPLFLKESSVAKHIRSDLVEELYAELESKYVEQMEFLYLDSMESFKSSLSKLRLSPNLKSDMLTAAKKIIASFADQTKRLRSNSSPSKSWPKANAMVSKLKKELNEFVTLRYQKALADGKVKPVPRSGITVGFHWMLPKPFGNDYRLEPWQVHTKDSVVYIPKDKITDIKKDDVLTGDWRKSIVPCPTASEMLYMK